MFQHAYQNGPAVEVVSSGDKNPSWTINKKNWKRYEKAVKGFVINVDTHSAKLLMPPNEKQRLALVQPYLVLQCHLHPTQSFTLEVTVSDNSGAKRRIMFSSAAKEITTHPMHARVPNFPFIRGEWANISIDLVGFVNACFPGNTYLSLEAVSVGSFCQLRKVFTMRGPLLDTTENAEFITNSEEVPKNLNFLGGVNYLNQLITPSLLGNLQPEVSKPKAKAASNKTTIAFGKKIPAGTAPIPQPKRKASPPRTSKYTSVFSSQVSSRPNQSTSISSTQNNFLRQSKISSATSTRYEPKTEEETIFEEEEKHPEDTIRVSEFQEEEEYPEISPIKISEETSHPIESYKIEFEDSLKDSLVFPEESKRSLDLKDSLKTASSRASLENPLDNENSFRHFTNYNEPTQMTMSIQEEIEEESYNPQMYRQDSLEHDFFPKQTQASPAPQPTYFAQGLTQATEVRPFTPPFQGLSSMQNIEVSPQEEAVELVYDPVLKCYYDPNTHEYYEINE